MQQFDSLPKEINFSTDPLAKGIIDYIINHQVEFVNKPNDMGEMNPINFISRYQQKKHLKKALEEVSKTPTGRASIHAFYYNTIQAQKEDPDFKYKIIIGDKENSFGTSHMGNLSITINPEQIKSTIQKTQKELTKTSQEAKEAELLLHGITFLHESMHIRQSMSGLTSSYDPFIMDYFNTYIEAGPQAMGQQIITESNNPILHHYFHISKKAFEEYQSHKGDLTNYSTQKIKDHTSDFLRPFDEKPVSDYATLHTRWQYIRQNLYIKNYDREKNQTHRDLFNNYIKTAHGVDLKFKPLLPLKLQKILSQHFENIKKTCSKEQINALQSFLQGKTNFPQHLFQDKKDKSSQAAFSLQRLITDLDNSFHEISSLTPKIQEKDPQALQKSKSILKKLEKDYGFTLPQKNKKGDTIAKNQILPTLQSNGENITQKNSTQPFHNIKEKEIA